MLPIRREMSDGADATSAAHMIRQGLSNRHYADLASPDERTGWRGVKP